MKKSIDIPNKSEIENYCKQNNYDDTIIIVDFSRYSGNCRMYFYNMFSKNTFGIGRVAHGIGKDFKNVFSPQFSNESGSWCSCIGKFKLGKIRSMNFRNIEIPCIELHGLDSTNSNAYSRGILIHPGLLTSLPTTPFPCEPLSQGCFTVCQDSFDKIVDLLESSDKPILLYAYK